MIKYEALKIRDFRKMDKIDSAWDALVFVSDVLHTIIKMGVSVNLANFSTLCNMFDMYKANKIH